VLARAARRSSVFATVTTAGFVWTADLVATGLKLLADRPRPFEVLPQADPLMGATVGTSFPSGHAATAFAGAICLAVVVRKAVPLLFVLAVAIAFSRIYVGVHYPLDVIAGAALGAAVALTVAGALRLRRRTSAARRRSEAVPPAG
jgi:undecaprenyl-diphosphatase